MRFASMHLESESLRLLLEEQCRIPSDHGIADVWVKGYPLASLYVYRGLMRSLLLDFKMKGSWQTGMSLVEIFVQDEAVRQWAKGMDYVMPVPSSFWGRWRGKHDLAFALAEGLSQSLAIPLLKAPRAKYFRFKKQSFLSRSERQDFREAKANPLSAGDLLKLPSLAKNDTNLHGDLRPQVLLIDDIVTSANTLTALAGAFRNINFRFLTLASAYHRAGYTNRSAGEKI
jgi:predicted amidophosphoribosyltransferase